MAAMVKAVLLLSVSAAQGAEYVTYFFKTSYNHHGGVEIDSDATAPVLGGADACKARCDSDAACDCASRRLSDGKCWKRSACVPSQFGTDRSYETFVKSSGPPAPPSPPTPPPPTPPTPPTPTGIKGVFAAIGDWGYNSGCHGNVRGSCQQQIGNEMKAFMEEWGDKFKFVVNVGDSFYCSGITGDSDHRWQQNWYNVYGDSNPARNLVNVPWYSVYGNHDMGSQDQCPCGTCHQVGSQRHKNWVMPDLTYHQTLSDLNVEVIGMDTNIDWAKEICKYVSCGWDKCWNTLSSRTNQAIDYFNARYEQSTAKTLIVFSHYPTDYLVSPHSAFFEKLKDNSKHNIVYFGGHRHNTDQHADSIAPNEQWLVGGGGGYGCDGLKQGFVKGFIHEDGSVTTEGAFTNVLTCCKFRTYSNGEPAPGPGSVEVVTCEGATGNCTSVVQEQGACVPSSDGGMVRLWCETNEWVKVDEMDAQCREALAWHMVPQDEAFSVRGASRFRSQKTTYKCDRAGQVPQGWRPPAMVNVPEEQERINTVRFRQPEVV